MPLLDLEIANLNTHHLNYWPFFSCLCLSCLSSSRVFKEAVNLEQRSVAEKKTPCALLQVVASLQSTHSLLRPPTVPSGKTQQTCLPPRNPLNPFSSRQKHVSCWFQSFILFLPLLIPVNFFDFPRASIIIFIIILCTSVFCLYE